MLKNQQIETPSWDYGNSGTRFNTYPWPGAARNVYEKIKDAAYVHKITGIAPSVALHIPRDKVGDYDALKQYAEDKGIRIGAINLNLFQKEEYKLGSLCSPFNGSRKKASDHIFRVLRYNEKNRKYHIKSVAC